MEDNASRHSPSPLSMSLSTTRELSSIEAALNSFINQQMAFNKGQREISNRLNGSVDLQIKNQEEMKSELGEIKHPARTVAEHEIHIKDLEQQVVGLSNQINELRGVGGATSESISSDIIISAVPLQLSNDLHNVVSKVLTSLQLPHLLSDVLNIRQVTRKNDAQATSSTIQSKMLLIVPFKSYNIAQFPIEKKTRKGVLTIKKVFDIDLRGNIYVNEFLCQFTVYITKSKMLLQIVNGRLSINSAIVSTPSTNLSVAQFNANSSLDRNDYIGAFFITKRYHIISISETWLKSNIPDELVNIDATFYCAMIVICVWEEEWHNMIIAGDLNCDLLSDSFEATYLRDTALSLSLKLLGPEPTHHTVTSDTLVDELSKISDFRNQIRRLLLNMI
ncbi:hypothetical protein PV327_010134 [Microctonus hyperodae]|uniref:Uncharacterized protein n=1 Tax=Microctonus hyperodae TaxID=165561 RepID=A0AA39FR90_MICHY|nr:hypothetical protein PV327_010134 [Microctonus hyperodae]